MPCLVSSCERAAGATPCARRKHSAPATSRAPRPASSSCTTASAATTRRRLPLSWSAARRRWPSAAAPRTTRRDRSDWCIRDGLRSSDFVLMSFVSIYYYYESVEWSSMSAILLKWLLSLVRTMIGIMLPGIVQVMFNCNRFEGSITVYMSGLFCYL